MPSGEGHDATLVVSNRNHQPPAEAWAQRADGEQGPFAGEKQATLAQGFLGKLALPQGRGESAILGRGEPDFKFLGQFEREAAIFYPISTNEFSMRRRCQKSLPIIIGREVVDIENFLAQ